MGKRKRTIVIVLLIALIVCDFLLIRGCFNAVMYKVITNFGPREWYYPISRGYQIDEFYYGNYKLTNTSGGNFHAEINYNVIAFCYNESYIGLQCTREDDIVQNELPEDV